MNILLLNQDWFATELRSFGHSVLTCGVTPQLDHRLSSSVVGLKETLSSLPNGFKPDVIVWLDDSAPVTYIGIEDAEVPTIFYSVDTHHHWDLHARLAHCFDQVLVAQKDYLHHFAPSGTPTSWFPLWAPRHVEPSKTKTMPMAFVGTMDARLNSKRVEFFTKLQQVAPITIKQGNYWEIFPHAEIVVNQTVKGDLNFRVFESMMCGGMLLTERSSNGLLELFHEGEHLVTYTAGDVHDVAEKATELLATPHRMHAIADAGRAEVAAKHTALHRASALNDILASITRRPKSPARHIAMMINHGLAAAIMRDRNARLSALSLQGAVESAVKSLREGHLPDAVESAHLIRSYLRWDAVTGGNDGSRLLLSHAEAIPSNYLLALARIRSLLNRGLRVEAETLASSISPDPCSHVFNTAEEAVSLLLR